MAGKVLGITETTPKRPSPSTFSTSMRIEPTSGLHWKLHSQLNFTVLARFWTLLLLCPSMPQRRQHQPRRFLRWFLRTWGSPAHLSRAPWAQPRSIQPARVATPHPARRTSGVNFPALPCLPTCFWLAGWILNPGSLTFYQAAGRSTPGIASASDITWSLRLQHTRRSHCAATHRGLWEIMLFVRQLGRLHKKGLRLLGSLILSVIGAICP